MTKNYHFWEMAGLDDLNMFMTCRTRMSASIFFFLIPSLYLAFQQTPHEHNHAAAAAARGGEVSAPPLPPAVMSCLHRREQRGVGPAGHRRPRAASTPTTVSSSQVLARIGVSRPCLREPAAAKSPGTTASASSVFLAGRWRGGSSPDPAVPAASSPGDGRAGACRIPRRRRLPRWEMEGRLLRRNMGGRGRLPDPIAPAASRCLAGQIERSQEQRCWWSDGAVPGQG